MPANVQITDFPHVLRVSLVQRSDARPGRCVVESTVDTEAGITSLPRDTTMTITTDSFNGTWSNMRPVKISRVRYGRMRTVLEDDRWKLWEVTMPKNFNERNSLGEVLTGTQKTVEELVSEIASVSGLGISVGSLPSYYPPAKWAGRKAGDCLQEMLFYTGCRMVYDPILSKYLVSSANTGAEPDKTNRIFRPAPQCKFKTLTVRSYPIAYEDTIDCTAVQINTSTGDADAIGSAVLPTTPIEDYGQTRFRLWKPDGVTHPSVYSNEDVLYLDRRVKAHIFDPEHRVYEKARIVRDDYERFPHHESFLTDPGTVAKAIELTAGGRAFLTDHPVLMTDATGVLLETCKLLTSYHVVEDGSLKRESVSVTLDGTVGELVIDADWIKPVDSTVSDMSGPVWSTVLSDAANAMSSAYTGEAGTLLLPTPISLGGSGRVGAVRYDLKTGRRPRVKFAVALNFVPGALGDVS